MEETFQNSLIKKIKKKNFLLNHEQTQERDETRN